ncbi:hypothetical protein H1R20_g10242, partial [Candolleomyces eurysporus]
MNELVEPLTFASIAIKFKLSAAPYIEHQMSTLASGNSPATRWTKRVTILTLMADTKHCAIPETMLTCQNRYLIPAIQALQNVQFASVFSYARRPDVEALQALSQIPTLRDLSISFPGYQSGHETLPLDAFTNLRVLTLKLTSGSIRTPMIQSIGPMVARYPALEELTLIEKYTKHDGVTNLDIFFEDPMHSPSFVPSLTKLTLRNCSEFTMSALSAPRLRSLVHLNVRRRKGNIDASFWRALAEIGAKIRYFNVYPLDAAAIRYLASYEGLEELHIQDHGQSEAQDFSKEVFHTVLPCHRQSLQQLTFSCFNFRSWCITDKYLGCVLKCTALRNLTLLYHHPEENREWPSLPQEKIFMDLSTLLTRITERLGKLETLKLLPIRHNPYFASGTGVGTYLDINDKTFEKEICESEITCAQIPAFQLCWMAHSRRFKPVEAKEEGLPSP